MKVEILIMLVILLARHVYAQSNHGQETDRIYVNAVAWSHDGSKIAAVGIRQPATQGYLRVMDVDTGRTLYQLDPNPGGFTSVVWSPDDRFIAAGGYDQVIWVIDVKSGNHQATLGGHQATVTGLDWSPDGSTLVSSGSWDGLVILWDMTAYQKIRNLEEGNLFPFTVAFSPDGKRIAIGGEGGLRIRSVNDEQLNPPWYFRELNVAALKWSHDGKRIAFGTQTFPSITNPNLKPAAQLYVIDSHDGTTLSNWPTEDETIYGLAWSPDDRLIATHSVDGVVRIWEVTTGTERESFPGTTQYPTGISFSPYGGRVAYASTIRADTAVSPTTQAGVEGAVQVFANSGVQIVVPAPSLDRLRAIANACGLSTTVEQSLPTQATADSLKNFMTVIQALPAGTIPPACAADLIAVTQAIQGQ
jgi:WD40 repeat protein